MAATFPAASVANLLSLPARRFAVVDVGARRARVVLAAVARGRPHVLDTRVVDSLEDGLTTDAEIREEVRKLLRSLDPEAVVLVVAQHQMLRHVLDVPPEDAAQTRALVEREASSIGGLSESQWAFDSVRLRPFGSLANPQAAAFCRQDVLQELIEGVVEDSRVVFDVRPAGDALAAAFRAARTGIGDALLIDLGATHTGLTILAGGQAVFCSSFPSGSNAFTEALAADRGGTPEAAEAWKRSEGVAVASGEAPGSKEALRAWVSELERAVGEWREDHPGPGAAAGNWPGFLAGGGALQPGLADDLSALGSRAFSTWPSTTEPALRPDHAAAWGALLLALGLAGPAPSLLPGEQREHWQRQRFWRALVSLNLVLAGLVALTVAGATWHQTRVLSEKNAWVREASRGLQHARDIRAIAEGMNTRMEALRPVLERQRQTVETLQVLGVLQRQRTNSGHWYVLLADGLSYATGSNDFAAANVSPRPADFRAVVATGGANTNAPVPGRTFVAEVCLLPQGEEMRKALSELVGELKRYPLFRNVDVLPAERRRQMVATNLIFSERHFAIELNLSEADLLAPTLLPKVAGTNREPRTALRLGARVEAPVATNGGRSARLR